MITNKQLKPVIGHGNPKEFFWLDPISKNIFRTTNEGCISICQDQIENPSALGFRNGVLGVISEWDSKVAFWEWSENSMKPLALHPGFRMNHPTQIRVFEDEWFVMDQDAILWKLNLKSQKKVLHFQAKFQFPHDFWICKSTIWVVDKTGIFRDDGEKITCFPIDFPAHTRILWANMNEICLLNSHLGKIRIFDTNWKIISKDLPDDSWCILSGLPTKIFDLNGKSSQTIALEHLPSVFPYELNLDPTSLMEALKNEILPFQPNQLGKPFSALGKVKFEWYRQKLKQGPITDQHGGGVIKDLLVEIANQLNKKTPNHELILTRVQDVLLREELSGPSDSYFEDMPLKENLILSLPLWAHLTVKNVFRESNPYQKPLDQKTIEETCHFLLPRLANSKVKQVLKLNGDENFSGMRIALLIGQPDLIDPLVRYLKSDSNAGETALNVLGLYYMLKGDYLLAKKVFDQIHSFSFEIKSLACNFLMGNKTIKLKHAPYQTNNYLLEIAWFSFVTGNFSQTRTLLETTQETDTWANQITQLLKYFSYIFLKDPERAIESTSGFKTWPKFSTLLQGSAYLLSNLARARSTLEMTRKMDHGSLMAGIGARLAGDFISAKKYFLEEEDNWPKWNNQIQLAMCALHLNEDPKDYLDHLPHFAWVSKQGSKIYAGNPSFLGQLSYLAEKEKKCPNNPGIDMLSLWFNWHLIDPIPFHVFW